MQKEEELNSLRHSDIAIALFRLWRGTQLDGRRQCKATLKAKEKPQRTQHIPYLERDLNGSNFLVVLRIGTHLYPRK